MQQDDLLNYKNNAYSQNGEDGIIEEIFKKIDMVSKTCCEFGAWDGVHLSNCRKLVLDGWRALMIEGEPQRFNELVKTYKGNPDVICINRFVDCGTSSLDSIIRECKMEALDFLSIDIDGLDYEIFDSLEIRPRVVCVEVNAGHDPRAELRISRARAKKIVGQPMRVFVEIADKKGYDLVCYNGNAFFVHRSVNAKSLLPVLSSEQAYQSFVNHLSSDEKEWLYLVNMGIKYPWVRYHNPYLSRQSLGISPDRAIKVIFKGIYLSCVFVLGYLKFQLMRIFTLKAKLTPV